MIMRDIRHEDRFTRELKKIQPNARRADEFIGAAEWVLSREPLVGILVRKNPPIYVLALETIKNHPNLSLFYTFNDDYVFFLSISVINPPPN